MLQTSIITILRGYESKRINAGGTSLDNTERLMQQFYDYRDQGFGPRHHRQGMQDFMNLTSDNRKLEKLNTEPFYSSDRAKSSYDAESAVAKVAVLCGASVCDGVASASARSSA